MSLPRNAFKNALKSLYNYLAGVFAYTEYLVDGAIAHEGVAVLTKGSAGAYTLSAPTLAENGKKLIITSATGYAHVVTATSGVIVDGTTGAKVTLTCAAFAGASCLLVAQKQKWSVVSVKGVTVG